MKTEAVDNYQICIVTGQYQKAPQVQQNMIKWLFGPSAESSYELYFHWFNMIHELGHAIMTFNALDRPHPAEEEQLVNHFAYAYWMHYGEPEKVQALTSIVHKALDKLTAPVPNPIHHLDYAKSNWDKAELYSFNNYGWFQFRCVQAAIAESHSLEQVLNYMCSFKVAVQKPKILEYEISTTMAPQVIADAAKMLKKWGIALPDKIDIVFCNDVNCHMCKVEEVHN